MPIPALAPALNPPPDPVPEPSITTPHSKGFGHPLEVLQEGRRAFPHKREDGSALDLLVFREDKFGCFVPLEGAFPSVFVQAVWAVVDLTKKG